MVHIPFLYLYPQVLCHFTHFWKFSILLYISLKISINLFLSLSSYSYGYPHKKWGLIHLYPSKNWHNYIYTQIRVPTKYPIRVPTKYPRLKLKLTSQLPTLSLPSPMNVPLCVFAPHISKCCPFNPTFCLLLILIPFVSSQM